MQEGEQTTLNTNEHCRRWWFDYWAARSLAACAPSGNGFEARRRTPTPRPSPPAGTRRAPCVLADDISKTLIRAFWPLRLSASHLFSLSLHSSSLSASLLSHFFSRSFHSSSRSFFSKFIIIIFSFSVSAQLFSLSSSLFTPPLLLLHPLRPLRPPAPLPFRPLRPQIGQFGQDPLLRGWWDFSPPKESPVKKLMC